MGSDSMEQGSRTDLEARAREVFLSAADLRGPEQKHYVERECGGDLALHSRVLTLLRHDQGDDGSFLDVPAAERLNDQESGLGDAWPGGSALTETGSPPRRLGQFELLEIIGEGGVGVVYRARQEQPLRREVAVKVIKPGM